MIRIICGRCFIAVCAVFVSMSISGCGKGSGSVTLQFQNATQAAMFLVTSPGGNASNQLGVGDFYTPTTFGIKLIAAYLSEDINPDTGNNVGNTAMIYLNSTCADDIMHCDISGGTAEDGNPMSLVVTDYFDLALPSAEVNAALNAQGRSITAGTYRYARLEFCKYNSGDANNLSWGLTAAGGAADDFTSEFQRNMCTVNSAAFAEPIAIAAGDTVTVSIAYSLADSVKQVEAESSFGDNCKTESGSRYCFTIPTFTPSASK
jgi:hypothetical protein